MAFERDLGYLDKFFDNLEAHAAKLEGDASARLGQLIGEERERWGEIRALLDGASTTPKGNQAPKAERPEPDAQQASAPETNGPNESASGATASRSAAPPQARAPQHKPTPVSERGTTGALPAGFTVGSLRSR